MRSVNKATDCKRHQSSKNFRNESEFLLYFIEKYTSNSFSSLLPLPLFREFKRYFELKLLSFFPYDILREMAVLKDSLLHLQSERQVKLSSVSTKQEYTAISDMPYYSSVWNEAQLVHLSFQRRFELLQAYVLINSGKRIRPFLVLAGFSLGEKMDETFFTAEKQSNRADLLATIALCCEYVHTYSLIHDDLPCMDNDELRHHYPTIHTFCSQAHGVLVGDSLLNGAWELLAKAITEACYYDKSYNTHYEVHNSDIKDNSVYICILSKINYLLSTCAGGKGMILGQIEDISSSYIEDFSSLQNLHFLKTAKLLQASLLSGYILSTVFEVQAKGPSFFQSESYLQVEDLLLNISRNLGLAFQIQDDIFDLKSDINNLGKTPGKDLKQNKDLSMRLVGYEESLKFLHSLMEEINLDLSALDNCGCNTLIFRTLIDAILNRRN